ncbi:unnamed protein product [Parnassius apollo]|uniref:(apollo) hypothetical protein n=1 Tax=Parnassius apollo TaxID=110799 RepID=A0A8S3W1N6_PARAO|nr:unnamed protein product [Parnassius apollo]
MHYLSLIFLTYILSESSGSLAPFIKPCKCDDTECLKASTQIAIPYLGKGIPELGVPPGDSLTFKEINADQGELKLTFRDTKLVGTSKCQVINVVRDVKESTISIEIDCPLLINGLYKLDGKLLFIPAQGDGNFEIKTNKVKIFATLKYKTVNGNNGQKHWKITGYDYSYDLIERVHIKLENLFNGDETRAKPILDILNNSWKELITEIGAPIIKELISKAVDSIKKFCLAVPTTELELL